MANPHSIAACLILKNEGKTIRKVLDSLQWCDQIICGIDSQSLDETEQICTTYPGVEVYKFDWKKSFAAARNEGFQRARSAWIIQPDGHEVLSSCAGWRGWHPVERAEWDRLAAHLCRGNYEVAAIQLWNAVDPNTLVPSVIFYAPRIYRSHCRMSGAAHNFIERQESRATVSHVEWRLTHERDHALEQARHEQRKSENLPNLEKDIAENPANARPYFYMAQTLNECGEIDKAIDYYQQHRAVCTFDSETYQGAIMEAGLRLRRGDEKGAIKVLSTCTGLEIYRNDHMVMLGEIYLNQFNRKPDQNKLQLAQMYLESAALFCADTLDDLPRRVPVTAHFVNGNFLTWFPYHLLAQVYDLAGDYKKALPCAERVQRFLKTGEVANAVKQLKKEIMLNQFIELNGRAA